MTLQTDRRSSLWFVSLVCLLACLNNQQVSAQVETEKRSFDVSEGYAINTLKEAAQQAEVEFIFSADLVKGVRTLSIQGEFTPQEAFSLMLAETTLEVFQHGKSGVYAITKVSDIQTPESEQPIDDTEMKPRNNNWLKKLAAILTLGIAMEQSNLAGQQEIEKENIFDLSPFTIEADAVEGYRATSTLAGTRLKTELRDVASTISVYTKEFLEDTGATNLRELLVYTTGTEVAGVGGNISNTAEAGSFAINFSPERFVPNSTTRVRGLASADNTRNFFSTLIPLDSYNIDRVTINRGANNILFGLGSPAGIIDRSLARPLSANATELEIRIDKYGSARGSFDVNRTLLDGDLNVRLIGLYDWREFRQEPAYDKTRRFYGAFDYFPTESTVLRVNFENGDRSSSPEMLAPPRDKFTTWWSFGKPTRPNGTTNNPDRFLDVVANAAFNPLLMYTGGAGDTESDFGLIALNNPGTVVEPGDLLYDIVAPGDRGNYQPRLVGVNDLNRYHTENYQFRGIGNPLSLHSRSLQIKDSSIFNYNEHTLTGRNDNNWNDFTAFNAVLQQDFIQGILGVALAFDHQEFDNGFFNIGNGSWRAMNIGIDASEALPDGNPNPNLGRPFFSATPRWSETSNTLETKRATSYFKFDAEEKLGDIGKWLGIHTFTGLLDQADRRMLSKGGPGIAFDQDFGDLKGYRTARNRVGSRLQANLLTYLGDSLLNESSPVGANVERLPDHLILPNQSMVTYINGETRKFETRSFNTFTFPNEKDILTTRASKEASETESYALAWQGMWLDELIVSTLGWRKDKFKNFVAGPAPDDERGSRILDSASYALPDVADIDTEDDTFSWGVVAHTPKSIRDDLPMGMDFDLHYSESENFAPTQVVRSPYGGFHSPPRGSTKDYGATISLLDKKIIAKLNWYETLQKNLPDSRLNAAYSWYFFNLARTVYESNTPEAIAAVGGIPLPSQEIQDAYSYNLISNPDGSVTFDGQNIGATDLITASSEGFEFELTANLTPNWRFAVNAAQQEAVRTGTAQVAGEEFKRLVNAWESNPDAKNNLIQGLGSAIGFRVNQFRDVFNSVLVTDGENASELREWRINAVTNYTFSGDTVLKGFGVGGAWRWQSSPVIGNEYYEDTQLGFVPDVDKPIWGPEESLVDMWFSYQRTAWKDVDWTLKLNIRNVFNEDNLIPVFHNPDGTGRVYRLGKERDWFITSTFSF